MHNRTSSLVNTLCLSLLLASSFTLEAKALRSPVQTGDDVIVAKGDIPTPDKYKPATEAFIVYATDNIGQIIELLNHLKESLAENNLEDAQGYYIKAHQHYEMIRPVVDLFGNTDRIINSRADYFLQGVNDYRFKGFHLVEYMLFKAKNKSAASDAVDELVMYVKDLKQRVEQEHIEIPKLVQSSADYIEMIIEVKLNGQENIYSHSDLADIAANMAGSEKIIEELKPFLSPETLKPILKNYQQIDQLIGHYVTDQGSFKPYGQLTNHDKKKLYSLLSDQAYLLATLRSTLNVDVYYKYQAETP
ncbi:EfeM/EfeO family lipoprotein [Photobacterium angustum]|uniref:EfeM/EfeO family lipoprotein n=1 Tax=Photobacterium angustum TaxID=661 RepID=UPI003D141C8C